MSRFFIAGMWLAFLLTSCTPAESARNAGAGTEEDRFPKEEALTAQTSEETNLAETGTRETLDSNFIYKKVLSGKVEILMPVTFGRMSAEGIAAKYPMEEKRPTEVFTNEEGTVNIAFNHTTSRISRSELPNVKAAFEAQFSNSPMITFIKSDIRKINGHDFMVLEFTSAAPDSRIYNLMAGTSVDNRLLLTTFNCTESERPEWEPIGKRIINSVKIAGH